MRNSIAIGVSVLTLGLMSAQAQQSPNGPYHVLSTTKVGGDGGWDYVYADPVGRHLYIPRSGPTAHITVFDLDTLKQIGDIPGYNGHGVAVDPKSSHAFLTSKPVEMFDSKSLTPIKTIEVQGNPDGLLFDPFNERVYIFSHSAPNATVINAADGSVVGTIDLGGAPEQAATDGQGRIYVDIEDKDQVAVIDARSMIVTAHYDLGVKGAGPGGLALDPRNYILFVACHNPATMMVLNALNGNVITTLPIGTGVDATAFNPNTNEVFSSQGDGTMTIIKENSPASFAVEQTVQTLSGARTMTIDTRTGKAYTVTAEYEPAPPLAPGASPPPPGRGPRRGPMIPGSFTIITVGK